MRESDKGGSPQRRWIRFLAAVLSVAMTLSLAMPQGLAMALTEEDAGSSATAASLSTGDSTTSAGTASTEDASPTTSDDVVTSDQTATPDASLSASSDQTATSNQSAVLSTDTSAVPSQTITADESDGDASMPAASFTGNASNGVSVAASAPEGAFPSGTTMQVSAVSTDEAITDGERAVGGEVTDAKAVDITFYDAAGDEVQPAGGASVRVSLTSADEVAGSEHSIVHVTSRGASKVADANATGATFDATSFSVYEIVGQPDGRATVTYEFYDDATTPTLLSTRIVKDGDTLLEPNVPVSAVDSSLGFLGWSTEADPTTYQVFGTVTIPSTTTSDTVVKLYARFQAKTYQVYFHNQYDTILQMANAAAGSDVHVADYNAGNTFPVPVGYAVMGWSTIKAAAQGSETGLGDPSGEVADITDISSDINLYPIIEPAWWITYDSDGGSFCAPVFFAYGTATAAPTDPARAGYTFGGWYTDSACTQTFAFGSPLSSDVTLYAKWIPNTVNYTVNYWQEALDNNGNYVAGNYVYAGSRIEQTSVDSQVSIDASNVGQSYTYYTFDHGDQNVTVDGNGTTVVNAYFDLNTYTLVFDTADVTGRTSLLTIGGSTYTALTMNGATVTGSSPYTFSAHYGENIADRWPGAGNISVTADASTASMFYGWTRPNGSYNYATKRLTVTGDLLSSTDDNSVTVYTANYLSSLTTYTINYWLEDANDTGYTKSTAYSQEVQAASGSNWSAKQITGFTYVPTTPDGYPSSAGNELDFYYLRGTYNLTFSSYGTIDKTVNSVKFGADISNDDYTPICPAALAGYTFGGWYTTAGCLEGTEYNFTSATMPTNNVILYAKWVAPQYTVAFDLNGGTAADGSPSIADQTDMYRKLVSHPDNPVRNGYEFAGWTLNGVAFDFSGTYVSGDVLSQAIDGVITLRATWIGGEFVELRYDADDGTDAPADTRAYYDGSRAIVGAASTTPIGKYFLYWKAPDGTVYYPGSAIDIQASEAVDGVFILTAVYGADPAQVALTYHANGGLGSDYTIDSVDDNGEITVLGSSDPKVGFTRAGYTFAGWNTAADGSGTSYAAGDQVRIDDVGGNNLYAQWKCEPTTIASVTPETGGTNSATITPASSAIASATPKTGDTAPIMVIPIIALAGLALLSIGFVTMLRRNRKRHERDMF